jgi:hypothetical protein
MHLKFLFLSRVAGSSVRYVCLAVVRSVIHRAHVPAPAFAFATSLSPKQKFSPKKHAQKPRVTI